MITCSCVTLLTSLIHIQAALERISHSWTKNELQLGTQQANKCTAFRTQNRGVLKKSSSTLRKMIGIWIQVTNVTMRFQKIEGGGCKTFNEIPVGGINVTHSFHWKEIKNRQRNGIEDNYSI